jgi:chemotaxis protein CheX
LPEGSACKVRIPLADYPELSIRAAGCVVRRDLRGMAIELLEMIGLDSLHHLRNLLLYNAHDPESMQRQLETHLGLRPRAPQPGERSPLAAHTMRLSGSEAQLPFSRHDLCSLVGSIWETLMNLEVQPLEGQADPPGLGESLIGRISITGVWQGEVLLECPLPLARHAAARFFGTEDDTATAEQINDVVGELTNMTGGNLKGMLPGPCELGLPTVNCNGSRALDARNAVMVAFQCRGLQFRVKVIPH